MRYRVEVADRPDALYALWNGRIFRAQRSTADASVLLVARAASDADEAAGADGTEDFDTEWQGLPAKVVPASEAGGTFALHSYCRFADEAFQVEPRSADGELTLRWAGDDERLAAELGLDDFTATTDDPDSLTGLWQERHDFPEENTPRTEPGTGDASALLRALGRTLRGFLPPGWQRVAAQFRQVGDYAELEVRAVAGDVAVSLSPPPELSQLFAQLRSAMYDADTGTWFQGTFTLDTDSKFDFDYDADAEPDWRLPPEGRTTARSYTVELGYHPRKNPPAWLAEKAGLPSDVTFRPARTVDGHSEADSKPVVNRAPVPQEEVQRVLAYLYRAPIVLTRPNPLADLFVPGAAPDVPDAFHTDGTWVWAAAVPHYLRKYGVPPESELLDHLRANEFRVPYVSAPVRAAAEADVLAQPRPPRPVATHDEPLARLERGSPLRASELLTALRKRLRELGVADSAYAFGEAEEPAGAGDTTDVWRLRRVANAWQVTGPGSPPRTFESVHTAADVLLGALLLVPSRSRLGVPDDAEAQEPPTHATDRAILPLRGEPPLTYYRGKRLAVLPEGTVVQRYGTEAGNLVHPDGTAFPTTSLAYEREHEVHRYVVRRPVTVLTGTAVPWAALPGGATAYLLPRAVGHHVETGALERR